MNGGLCMPIAPARTMRRLRLRNSEPPDSDVFTKRIDSTANRTVPEHRNPLIFAFGCFGASRLVKLPVDDPILF